MIVKAFRQCGYALAARHRGSGDIAGDCCFTARQRVQQARFTGVRTSGNHHFHPFAQQLPDELWRVPRRDRHVIELARLLPSERKSIFIREINAST